jgi:SAM-dependent methyltransferase
VPGITVEVGAGIGKLKRRLPTAILTDVQPAPWLDCVADGHRLPFAAGALANLVMLDVLHHLQLPAVFLREAERVLRPGGRLVMLEPAITWLSSPFYRLLHHEPVRMSADVLAEGEPDPRRDPYAANQAIPTLIATRHREMLSRRFPGLRLASVTWLSLAAYPMSGGFQPWSLIGPDGARRLLGVERMLEPWLGRFMGFRMMLVVERTAVAAT